MEVVGAAARDHVDLRAAGAAELRAVAVAVNLELLDRVHRRVDEDRTVAADVVVVGAVDRPHVRRDRAAADGQVGAAEQPLVLDVQEVRRADAGHQERELQEVAAVERKIADLLTRDETGDVATDRLHLVRVGFDGDLLFDLTGRELDVHRAVLRGVERDRLRDRTLEPGVLDHDLIRTDRQLEQRIHARLVRRRVLRQTRVVIPDGDLRARDHGTRLIRYCSTDRGRESLREGRDRQEQCEHWQQPALEPHVVFPLR